MGMIYAPGKLKIQAEELDKNQTVPYVSCNESFDQHNQRYRKLRRG
jgi:hypothetical protein